MQFVESPALESHLVERPFFTHVNLRVDPGDAEALASVQQVLGVALPLTPNTTAQGDGPLAIWLGPDEWLLLAESEASGSLVRPLRNPASTSKAGPLLLPLPLGEGWGEGLPGTHPQGYAKVSLVGELQTALAGRFASVVDTSAGQTVIRLSGPSTLDVLARGCALDLDPSVFPPGACAQTLLARAQALLVAVDDTPTFDIVVRRSFAPYVAAWLEDSGRQFGLYFPASETP